MEYLKKFDHGLARGEAALATTFLLAMILLAAIQALFRNLSDLEIQMANEVLAHLDWVDPFLQKGTLWLAFLGASIATRDGRHISIDLLPRFAGRQAKLLMRGVAAFGAAVVSFFLARAFWSAVLVNAAERPADYDVYGDNGMLHVCQAAAEGMTLPEGVDVPLLFCGVRSFLSSFGIPVETPEAALQLIVPVMFVVMCVRLVGNGVGAFMRMGKPETEEERLEALGDAAAFMENAHASEDEAPSESVASNEEGEA